MLRNRHFISYFSTTFLYLTVGGLFFYAQNHYLVSSKKSEEKSIQLCISTFQPEVVTTVEQVEQEQVEEVKEIEEPIVEEEPVVEEKPVIEEEPVIEPEVLKEPIPEKKPEIKEEVIPEPVVPKPVVKKVKKKPEVKKKPKKKTVKKKTAKKKQVRQKASSRRSKSSKAEKNQFLANVRAKINKHKSYPRVAKKRRMQGSVKVKFTILRSGKVGKISLNGPKIFHNSARAAVKSAFPVNAKNAPISLPQSINLTLRYQLR